MALANGEHAGVAEWLHVEKRALGRDVAPPAARRAGRRPIRRTASASARSRGCPALYSELGRVLRERFRGWQAAILTGNPPLARHLGVYAKRTHRFYNGTIECRLLRFELDAASEQRPREEVRADWSGRPGAQMFANRLRKNLQRLEPWARARADRVLPRCTTPTCRNTRSPSTCTAASRGTSTCRNMRRRRPSIRRAPASGAARCWRCCPRSLSVPLAHVHSRVRKPQKGGEQYEKRDAPGRTLRVQEGGLKFWVNFRDYLDTGLFLDHRIMRAMLREWAKGADFLNLFCYTGSATVYAAAGGARSTTSVDLSNTYLDWAHENLLFNGFGGPEHEFYRADCLRMARGAGARRARASI